MKKLLLITGDLATGKSTFAGILSERYGVIAFCKDDFKETLGDCIGFSNRAENKKLSIAAVELMIRSFSEFAKLEKPLILEANFYSPELEKLHKMAGEHGCDVLTLEIRAGIEILHKRYLNRMHNENRHPAHLIASFDTLEGFKEYIEDARAVNIPGNKIYVEADDFGYQKDAALLKKIDEFMKA